MEPSTKRLLRLEKEKTPVKSAIRSILDRNPGMPGDYFRPHPTKPGTIGDNHMADIEKEIKRTAQKDVNKYVAKRSKKGIIQSIKDKLSSAFHNSVR